MNQRSWQIIGAIATVVAVFVAVGAFYFSQRASTMALTAEVISSSTLLNAEFRSRDLRIIYKGKDVPNIAVSHVRIANTGRQPIRSDDIESPVRINIESTEIISSKVISSDPSDLPVSTSNAISSVIISKALLNPGDEITVEIVSVPEGSTNVVSGVSGRNSRD